MSELSARDQAVLACVFHPQLPLEDALTECELKDDDEDEITPLTLKVKQMELEAVEAAEQGNLQNGLDTLNDALEMVPDRPSLYNNRAHVYQYMRRFEDAFNDLTTAIELCTEKHRKTLSQAYCQRGALHKRAGRKNMAEADFKQAASLGSKFAKNQLVELNSYAALCNRMLRQMMEKIQ